MQHQPSGALENDTIANCVVAACMHQIQTWGGDEKKAFEDGVGGPAFIRRFFVRWCSSDGCKYWRVLWAWQIFGIGGGRPAIWAMVTPREIEAATKLLGCTIASMSSYQGASSHAVEVLGFSADSVKTFSWGRVVDVSRAEFFAGLRQGYAVSPKLKLHVLWWRLKNHPTSWAIIAGLAGLAAMFAY